MCIRCSTDYSDLGLLSEGVCSVRVEQRVGWMDGMGGWVGGNGVLEIHIRPKMDESVCLGIECILKGDFSAL